MRDLKRAWLLCGHDNIDGNPQKKTLKKRINELEIKYKKEPVAYNQLRKLVNQYTPGTPQSHQCGFIAQSLFKKADELNYAISGNEIYEQTQLDI